MLEWLGRDPLNGIVLSIAFFISLIAGRYLREKKAQSEYTGRMIEPRIKLIASFLLVIAVSLMEHWYFPIAVSVLCMIIGLRLKIIGDYSRKLLFPLLFAFFILALQSLTYGMRVIDLGIIQLYSEGLNQGILIFSRVSAAASVLILLSTTTSINDIYESMRWCRIPGTILEISFFMGRYIKSFSNEGETIRTAQISRCGLSGSSTNKIKNIAAICGLLILRAFTRSEEVYRAMISRSWKQGLQYSHNTLPLHRSDMILGILLSSGIIGLLLLDRSL